MLDRIAEFFVFGVVPLAVGLLATPVASVAAEQVLKGEVTYRERIALPPGAQVTVELADVSLADAPAAIVAKQSIAPSGQVPIPFELKFDSSAVQAKHTYTLQARITVDDQLVFMNVERHEVDPLAGGAPQTVVVAMVRKKGVETVPIVGQVWSLQFIDGIGAVEGSRATFEIDGSGKVTGRAPCNGYFASAEIEGSTMTVGKPGATMMACEETLMQQEHAFFDALEKVAAFRVENGLLILTGKDGRDLLRFAASA